MNRKELLGKNLREYRKNKGFTQDQLAEIIDIEPQSISKIESGINFPLLSNLDKIADILDADFKDFFEYSHQRSIEELRKDYLEIFDAQPENIQRLMYKIIKSFENF